MEINYHVTPHKSTTHTVISCHQQIHYSEVLPKVR